MGILVLLSNMYVHSQNSFMLNTTALKKILHGNTTVLRNLTAFKREQRRESFSGATKTQQHYKYN